VLPEARIGEYGAGDAFGGGSHQWLHSRILLARGQIDHRTVGVDVWTGGNRNNERRRGK
jgi:hypothetical protein